ncbi:MAG TPA: hypothetical protein VNW29_01600 [Candidatus Sulfotelmatobacter sp.]|jgi:hypothetical protein|nr:hypothetical protein [Candidatus Sulfotelmatobacter sp.]
MKILLEPYRQNILSSFNKIEDSIAFINKHETIIEVINVLPEFKQFSEFNDIGLMGVYSSNIDEILKTIKVRKQTVLFHKENIFDEINKMLDDIVNSLSEEHADFLDKFKRRVVKHPDFK